VLEVPHASFRVDLGSLSCAERSILMESDDSVVGEVRVPLDEPLAAYVHLAS
jgi:hypothetical protein